MCMMNMYLYYICIQGRRGKEKKSDSIYIRRYILYICRYILYVFIHTYTHICIYYVDLTYQAEKAKKESTTEGSKHELIFWRRRQIPVCMCTCVRNFVCVFICVYVWAGLPTAAPHSCVYVYVYAYLCVCVFICVYVCVCLPTAAPVSYVCCVCVYVCVSMCVCIYLCVLRERAHARSQQSPVPKRESARA